MATGACALRASITARAFEVCVPPFAHPHSKLDASEFLAIFVRYASGKVRAPQTRASVLINEINPTELLLFGRK